MADHNWFDNFDERQKKQIKFATVYEVGFGHGADGHNNMLIIAKMASLLDAAYAQLNANMKHPVTTEEIDRALGLKHRIEMGGAIGGETKPFNEGGTI